MHKNNYNLQMKYLNNIRADSNPGSKGNSTNFHKAPVHFDKKYRKDYHQAQNTSYP